MATTKQTEANRCNAKLSTGPKTPEGKAIASRNSRRHGLTSRDTVIPDENTNELKRFLADLTAEHQPATPSEQCLVAQMAAAEWRLRRISRIESGLLAERLEGLRAELQLPRIQPPLYQSFCETEYLQTNRLLGRLFNGDCRETETLAKLLRYENSIRRAFYKALHELRLVQKRRTGADAPKH